MKKNTFSCIKPTCDNRYDSEDADAYYCPDCFKEVKEKAVQIDSRMGTRSSVSVMSDLQAFEATAQTVDVNGRKITFARA